MTVMQYIYRFNNDIIQELSVFPTNTTPKHVLAPPCQSLCNFNLHRFHLTCIFDCTFKKMYYERNPWRKIQIRTLIIKAGLPYWRVKICKFLATLHQIVGNH